MTQRRNTARQTSVADNIRQPQGWLVKLRAPGNPDFRQYADIAPRQAVAVASLEEAVRVCMAYIAEFELGIGNWGRGAGEVLKDGKKYAWISWNGRVWLPDMTTPHPDYESSAKAEAPGA